MTAAGRSPVYPLPLAAPHNDPRFDCGLVFDVARVLEAHDYPALAAGHDLLELSQALFRFIYSTEDKV
ncbi:hypothetical protein IHE61_06900 [Streptomyces sp. GKU 257-1]|nr:hypothetical protein [Streptomyces sp. GKU 257-1]